MLLRGARFEQWGSLALAALVAACTQSPGETTAAATGNHAPVISGTPPTAVVQGVAYSFTPTASDPDGDALTFGIDAKPSWGVFDTSTGRLSGAPGATDVGVARGIVIWVSDGHGQTALPAFDVTVSAQPVTNHAPTISGTPPTAVVAGATYSFTPSASDPDGNTLTFTVSNKPAWATFSATTGQLQGVPQLGDVGTFANIGITVSDGQATVSLPAFGIVVTAPAINHAPVISGTPMTSVAVGQAYSFAPTASDPDAGTTLTFSIANKPAWAAFSTATGQLQGTPTAAGTFAGIAISVSDGQASASLPAFSIVVSQPNRPPTISGSPPTTASVGTLYTFTPTASDPDAGTTLTFGVANKPAWATFSTTTGQLSGTPTAAGTSAGIAISVTDGQATATLPAFSIVVSQPNRAPTISGTPATTATVGTAYTFTPTASDPDGDTLTFSIANKPAWATFSTSTGQLQGTPTATGTFSSIAISVSDGKAASVALPAFSITVGASNSPPTISGSPPTTASVGTLYTFTPTASDPDAGTTLTFSITNRPTWATFNGSTGQLTGTPTAAGTSSNITISVSDGQASASLAAFSIVVTQPNRPPTISGTPATTATTGVAYSFTPTASDPDGDTLTFSIANMPAWATFSASTGQLQGTPSATGTFANIAISVSDGKAASVALPAFSITVGASNSPPTISGSPPTTGSVGALYTFTPTASDPDSGTTLTFSITNRPAWATFNGSTGQLTGTPTAAGTFSNITISVSDGQASASLAAFSIVVTQPNRPPTISGTPATTATTGVAYSFTPTASDPDGDTLTFSIANRPAWATFSTTTGQLQGTPTAAGTFSNVSISVSDGNAPSVALSAFSITVAAANNPPTISGTPPTTGSVGTLYTFTPTASDPDAGTTLTFSVANKPSWATFSTTTGRLQGTPSAAGTFANIAISVSDGQASASLAAFSIVVTQPNRPPTISGTPATSVMQGTSYSFTPTASDPDGDTLTFAIANQPAWATFSTTTGRLQGTPGAGDVGTTSGIVISVSDGQAPAVALATFSVTVQAVATGSATLTWNPPTQNTDGSPLTDLAGYKIYWGTSQGTYPNSVTLTNPGLTSYVVTNLVSGTYYFVATALNSEGVESSYSASASKTIP
jgi:hypothetical protein